jgi:hypothetical protein
MRRTVYRIELAGIWVGAVLLFTAPPFVQGANEVRDEAQGGTSKHGCFYIRDASDFDVLDNSNFIVYAPTKSRAFHVRVAPPSNELKFANGLAFAAQGERICGYAGESVAFGRGGGARRYSITSVWQLDTAALENLLDTYNAGSKKNMPKPNESEGADVERDLSGDAAK